MRLGVLAAAAVSLAIVSGCSSTRLANGGTVYAPDSTKVIPQVDTSKLLPAQIPYAGSIVPATTLQLTPSLGIPLEKIVFWGAYAGAAYLILDPLAPNWDIEVAPLPQQQYHLSLHMKRFYAGGAGEARVVFNRRAKELMKAGEYDAYQILEYSEGMESSVLGSRRVATGVIQLTKKEG